MKAIETNSKLLAGYLQLLNHLSSGSKRELITKLSESIDTSRDASDGNSAITEDFIPEKSADEIIAFLKNSRTFNRDIESF